MLNVPLTGSMIAGPLGLAHLPRMWQKGLLKNVGSLDGSYGYGRGFDLRMMDGVGIDPDAFLPFIGTLPTYLATEAWVRAKATKLDQVETTSAGIVNHEYPANLDGDRKQMVDAMQQRAGAGPTYRNGPGLNNIDDWSALHDYVSELRRAGRIETIVPAVSSLASGPSGIRHLPRLWTKAVIKEVGGLPEGYHSGTGPRDTQCAETLGFDLAESVRYTSTLPTYMAYEAWVLAHATTLDPETVAAWNERNSTREKPEELAAQERQFVGLDDPRMRGATLLNDLIDWHLFHGQIVAESQTPAPQEENSVISTGGAESPFVA